MLLACDNERESAAHAKQNPTNQSMGETDQHWTTQYYRQSTHTTVTGQIG